jgi:hypothetical protein
MAEADPAALRQPTAAEKRLSIRLEQQRSNGAIPVACAVTAVTQHLGSLFIDNVSVLTGSLVLIEHMQTAQAPQVRHSLMPASQMRWWDGATTPRYPASRNALVRVAVCFHD